MRLSVPEPDSRFPRARFFTRAGRGRSGAEREIQGREAQGRASWGMSIGLAAALFVTLLLKHHPVGQRFEFDSLDIWFNLRDGTSSNRVALAVIDDATVRSWNGRTFNGRDVALLLRRLKKNGVLSVSLALPSACGSRSAGGSALAPQDVASLEPAVRETGFVFLPLMARSQFQPSAGSLLDESLSKRWGVPLPPALSPHDFPVMLGMEGPPQKWLEQAAGAGHAAFGLDVDGRPRTSWPGLLWRGRVFPSLALAVAQREHGQPWAQSLIEAGQPLLLDFSPLSAPQAALPASAAQIDGKRQVLGRLSHFLQRGLDFSRAKPSPNALSPAPPSSPRFNSPAPNASAAPGASSPQPAHKSGGLIRPAQLSASVASAQTSSTKASPPLNLHTSDADTEAAPTRGFVRVSVARLLRDERAAQVLAGKHVIVCVSAHEMAPLYFAPDGRRVLEGELHAVALDNLLSGSVIVAAPEIVGWVLAILSCVVVGGFVAARPTLWSAIVTLLCLLTIFVLSAGLFAQNVWLDITPPWLGIGLTYLTGVIGRARRDTREATRYASTVDVLSRSEGLLAAQNSVEELLGRVLDWSVASVDAERASALLLSGDKLLFAASVGPGADKLKDFTLQVGEGIEGWVAQQGQSAFSNDTRSDKRFSSDIDVATGLRTRSLACVPFKANGRTLGVLSVANRRANRPWTRADVELLEAIATQSALALDNARLYEILNRRVQSSEESLEDANRRLETERNLLSTVLHSMTDGVIVIDGDEHIRMVNRAASKLLPELQRSQGSLLGKILKEYPGDFVRLPEDRRGGRSSFLQRGDPDAPRFIEARSSPLPLRANRNGERGEVIVFADVTEEKHIEQAKSDFVSFVAHEMRSPLTTISGFSSMLHRTEGSQTEPNPQRLRFLGLIHDESERLKRLINSLLDVSRIEAGHSIEIHVEPYDFAPVALKAIESQRVYSSRHRIVSQWPEALPPVLADRDKTTQVLINLLSNAMKYSPGGVVTVEASVTGDHKYLQVGVRDEGPGIPPEQQKRLFERFGRLSNPVGSGERAKPSGTGLGLFLSKHLVELQGGTMRVESEEGKGTTFFFTLPLSTEGQSAPGST